MSSKDWFEHKGDKLLWEPPPSAAEMALELLFESQHHQPYKSCLMLVP